MKDQLTINGFENIEDPDEPEVIDEIIITRHTIFRPTPEQSQRLKDLEAYHNEATRELNELRSAFSKIHSSTGEPLEEVKFNTPDEEELFREIIAKQNEIAENYTFKIGGIYRELEEAFIKEQAPNKYKLYDFLEADLKAWKKDFKEVQFTILRNFVVNDPEAIIKATMTDAFKYLLRAIGFYFDGAESNIFKEAKKLVKDACNELAEDFRKSSLVKIPVEGTTLLEKIEERIGNGTECYVEIEDQICKVILEDNKYYLMAPASIVGTFRNPKTDDNKIYIPKSKLMQKITSIPEDKEALIKLQENNAKRIVLSNSVPVRAKNLLIALGTLYAQTDQEEEHTYSVAEIYRKFMGNSEMEQIRPEALKEVEDILDLCRITLVNEIDENGNGKNYNLLKADKYYSVGRNKHLLTKYTLPLPGGAGEVAPIPIFSDALTNKLMLTEESKILQLPPSREYKTNNKGIKTKRRITAELQDCKYCLIVHIERLKQGKEKAEDERARARSKGQNSKAKNLSKRLYNNKILFTTLYEGSLGPKYKELSRQNLRTCKKNIIEALEDFKAWNFIEDFEELKDGVIIEV